MLFGIGLLGLAKVSRRKKQQFRFKHVIEKGRVKI